MGLKLYGLPMSTCTTRVMTCLYEKGIGFELIPLNVAAGEHKQPSFLSKNPFGQFPALEDDDLKLFESRAITAYVGHKYKDTGADLIRHGNIKEAALVGVWIEVESQHFNPAISPIIVQIYVMPIHGKSPDQKIIKEHVDKLGKVLDVYEARLSNTKYLAGDFYSMADLHHLPFTHYLMKTEWASLINSRPHVKAWWEDISSRTAFQKVVAGMKYD